jgi:hypothetical protein
MSTITIDGTEYSEDSLSKEAKAELAGMQACDQKIAVMQTEFAIAQTARNAYAGALKGLLPKASPKAKAKAKPKTKAKKT